MYLVSIYIIQIDWNEQQKTVDALSSDLSNSWKYLRAIARQETSSDCASTDKKMKSAKSLTDAAERLRVIETISRRVKTRFHRLLMYMGMRPSQAEKAKVNFICNF